MERLATLSLLLAIGFSTTSCGFINGLLNRGDNAETTESLEADEVDVVAEDQPEIGDQPEIDVSEEGASPETLSPVTVVPVGLLGSTDSNERLKEIAEDRSDPYAYVPVSLPPPAIPPLPEPEEAPAEAEPEAEPEVVPPVEPITLPPLDLPDIPEPTAVASQVELSGIVQVNGETYAIVQAPGEPTSRYVKVGDRISGGNILVKRIETRPGNAPVVVLEERGVEIALPVGSGAENREDSAVLPPEVESEVAVLPSLR